MTHTQETVHEIVRRQRDFFRTGETLDVGWRIAQLKKLKQAVIDNRSALEKALYDDLGKSPMEAYLCDLGPSIVEINEIIRGLKGKVTVILTTHYMEEAEELSDRVASMKVGKLLVCDTPDGIKRLAGTENFEQAFIRIVKGVAE